MFQIFLFYDLSAPGFGFSGTHWFKNGLKQTALALTYQLSCSYKDYTVIYTYGCVGL